VTRALPDTAVVDAPAKLNAFLRVLGRRDDGYHDLESLVLRLDLADRLEVHAHAGGARFRTLSFALDVTGEPAVTAGVPVDEDNLVLRAAKVLADHRGIRGFADISLHKLIPAAAGLGGGSADAAAVLVALDRLWGCGLSPAELLDLAASVGSDVPALLSGDPVVVGGRGERVAPVTVADLGWVLVTFDFGVRTPDAFAWWDEDGGPTGPDPRTALLEAEASTRDDHRGNLGSFAAALFNDLAGPVIRRHHRVGEVQDRLRVAGAAASVMCGSGPTVAGLLPPDVPRLDRAAEEDLLELSGRGCRYVRSLSGRPERMPEDRPGD
jgi:4-diphosphocytidyl-2-C-methyl-D-erythritol kinase